MGNDDPAFVALFRSEYESQVRTAYLIVGDQGLAQEIAQESFARAMSGWRRLRTYDNPGAWLRLVTVRQALRTRDRRAHESTLEEASVPTAELIGPSEDRVVVAAVLSLPRAQRAAVALHYLCDAPVDEVARLMGTKPSTVRVHLHRARKRLAIVLGEEMSDDPC